MRRGLTFVEGWVCRVCGSVPERGDRFTAKSLSHELAVAGTTGLGLVARSCSLLKVDPHVLHRHSVIGDRAAFATFMREGLKDKASSPPHCKHKRLDIRSLIWGLQVIG